MKALERARQLGQEGVLKLIEEKGLVGRGGAAFPTAKKWRFAIDTEADERFVICNADEGEPGTFKDRFILMNNPEAVIEGIIIAAETIKAKRAFIYLRGEYQYLEPELNKLIDKMTKEAGTGISIEIIIGAGAYVCGEETAIMESIEGKRGQPYYKPPFPAVKGLWGKPTVLNNVSTMANISQAILFDDWDPNLRLMSVSGNVNKPGIYEKPVGTKLTELIEEACPQCRIKAIYFGCFGGCLPYSEMELSPDNACGKNCIVGAFSIIAIGENQSIVDITECIAEFYKHESCGKCTPCREGTARILEIISNIKAGSAKPEDLDTLQELAEYIHETSLCGLGQTATNHVLNALEHFRDEFEANIK